MLARVGRGQDLGARVLPGRSAAHASSRCPRARPRAVAHTDLLELAPGGAEHRPGMPEVRRAERDLSRQDDLMLVHDGLRVVTLGVATTRANLSRDSPKLAIPEKPVCSRVSPAPGSVDRDAVCDQHSLGSSETRSSVLEPPPRKRIRGPARWWLPLWMPLARREEHRGASLRCLEPRATTCRTPFAYGALGAHADRSAVDGRIAEAQRVLLIGHSQGSGELQQLITTVIEGHSTVKSKMVCERQERRWYVQRNPHLPGCVGKALRDRLLDVLQGTVGSYGLGPHASAWRAHRLREPRLVHPERGFRGIGSVRVHNAIPRPDREIPRRAADRINALGSVLPGSTPPNATRTTAWLVAAHSSG